MKRIEKEVPVWWVVLGIGFFVGIIYGNIRYHAGDEMGLSFSRTHIVGLAESVTINFAYVFRVLRSRATPGLCLWLFGKGRWQRILRNALMIWFGWLLGMASVSAVAQQGAFGLALYVALWFPHFIFYGIAYGWLFQYLKDVTSWEENQKTGALAVVYFCFGCLWEICILPVILRILFG